MLQRQPGAVAEVAEAVQPVEEAPTQREQLQRTVRISLMTRLRRLLASAAASAGKLP